MPEVRWGLIDNGATFEHLVQTLVLHLDPKAIAFGRPGKDGGQDIRSGDGSLVYQCKFHQDGSTSRAIADAQKEAEKIKSYRAPGHTRFAQWASVTRWRLVTNAPFNTADEEKWKQRVVPLFRNQGLEPEFWGREKLKDLLAANADIAAYFFEGENRVLLSIGEAARRLETDDPFRPARPPVPFQGRGKEIGEIQAFLKTDKLFLLIHGQGAVGKTRLALEAGLQVASGGDWQVLWGLTSEMSHSSSWLPRIARERTTLLIVDDPELEDSLKRLAEQLSGSLPWKVLVVARSPHDPVVKFLQTFGIREKTQFLPINPLPLPEAIAIAKAMIEDGPLGKLPPQEMSRAAEQLAAHLDRCPGWIAIAAKVIETEGNLANLPLNIGSLAEKYLDEILKKQNSTPEPQLLTLLRCLALLGGVNREDAAALERIKARADFPSRENLFLTFSDLVRRRVVIERGARGRIIEVKPDVIRDYILEKWLAFDKGFDPQRWQPSQAAKDLAINAAVQLTSAEGQREVLPILQSLARIETTLALSGKEVPILATAFDQWRNSVPTLPASRLRSMIQLLAEIAADYPGPIVELSRAIRTQTIADEQVSGLLGARTVGRRDVVLELAWMVFNGALGVQEQEARHSVLRELYELAILEKDLSGGNLPNDGKRAGKLLQRVIEGGPSFWTQFDDAAMPLAKNVLNQLAGNPSQAQTKAAEEFLEAVTALGRTRTWTTDNRSVSIQRFAVSPDSPGGRLRVEVLGQIKARIAMPIVAPEKRIVYWRILAEAHGNANSVRLQHKDCDPAILDELSQDLRFALSVLPGRSFEELAAARPLWSWHVEFDENPELSRLGKELEQIYAKTDLAGEFEPLVAWEHADAQVENAKRTAQKLAAEAEAVPTAIAEFLDRASAYLAATPNSTFPTTLAWHLGALAPERPAVAAFILAQLGDDDDSWRGDFTRICAAGWMDALRKRGGERPERRLEDLLAACRDDLHRAALVARIYDRHSIRSAEPSVEEIRRVRSMANLFLAVDRSERFATVLGGSFDCDPLGFRAAAESMSAKLNGDALRDAVVALATAMATRVAANVEILPGSGEWLLDQLARIPKPYEIREIPRTYVQHFVRHAGKPSLDWLAKALERRADEERQSGQPYSYLGNEILAKFVEAVSEENESESAPAILRLVKLAGDRGGIGHDIPDILRYADPKGILAPVEVARMLRSTSMEEDLIGAARCVRAYGFDSEPWRIAARPILERTMNLPDQERMKYYSLLVTPSLGPFSQDFGGIPQQVIDCADAARTALQGEADPTFTPFREWWVKATEAELQQWRDRAEEEGEA